MQIGLPEVVGAAVVLACLAVIVAYAWIDTASLDPIDIAAAVVPTVVAHLAAAEAFGASGGWVALALCGVVALRPWRYARRAPALSTETGTGAEPGTGTAAAGSDAVEDHEAVEGREAALDELAARLRQRTQATAPPSVARPTDPGPTGDSVIRRL